MNIICEIDISNCLLGKMATSFQLDFTGLDEENLKTARSIQEVWRGRFGEKEAIKLLRHNDWNRDKTVNFIVVSRCYKCRRKYDALPRDREWGRAKYDCKFCATDAAIRNVLNPNWQKVVGMRSDEVLTELAKKDSIDTEIRQFACQEDSNMWWRRVPERKPVSRCYKCRRKYDALPRDREWGRAKYDCKFCGNAFTGNGIMGVESRVCYKCGNTTKPSYIKPPMKYDDDLNIKINQRMSNVGRGRGRGGGSFMQVQNATVNIGLDKKVSNNNVIYGSRKHVSTGSTVNTFLNQDDIDEDYRQRLDDIQEEDDD